MQVLHQVLELFNLRENFQSCIFCVFCVFVYSVYFALHLNFSVSFCVILCVCISHFIMSSQPSIAELRLEAEALGLEGEEGLSFAYKK